MIRKQSAPFYIFFTFFAFYMFLGMCISFRVIYPQNIFFEADNYRAFLDLTDISYNHYRITVHPLLLVLLEAPTIALIGIVQKANLAVIIMEAIAGALSVSLMERITYELHVEKRFRYVLAFIYGMSFCMLLFSTIPETFIFSGLIMESFWYVLILLAKAPYREGDHLFYKRECFILCCYGVLSFGVTLTNYAFYLIGLATILAIRAKGRRKAAIKDFLMINIICGIVTSVLCVIQKLAWRQSPFFLMSFLRNLTGSEPGETMYMDITPSLSKLVIWVKETLCYPLLCPSVYLDTEEAWYPALLFGNYSRMAIVVLILFFTGFICAIIFAGCKAAKMEMQEKAIVSAMTINLVGNLLLHYIYDSSEAFIFSCHYIFLLFILYSYLASKIHSGWVRNILFALLSVVAMFEIVNNIARFFDSVKLAMIQPGEHFSLLTAVIGTFLCVLVLFFGTSECMKYMEKSEDRLLNISKFFIGYFIVAIIVTAFIGFSVQTITIR